MPRPQRDLSCCRRRPGNCAFGRASSAGRPIAGDSSARTAADTHQVVREEVVLAVRRHYFILDGERSARFKDDVVGAARARVGGHSDADGVNGMHRQPRVGAPVCTGNRLRDSLSHEDVR